MLKAILFFLVGVGLVIGGAVDMMHTRALDSHGKKAQLEPITQYTEVTKKKYGVKVGTKYKATLTFKTESGTPVVKEHEITKEDLDKFAAGQPVYIEYLPENPDVTRLNGKSGSGGGLFVLLGLALAGFSIFKFTRRNA